MAADADEGVSLVWSARGLAYVLGKRGVGEPPPPAAGGAARVELRVAGGELRAARWVEVGGDVIPEGQAPVEGSPRR